MLRGLRFQKRLRVLPGVRINLSKSGASASVGPRGADVNIGPRGVSANAGIPGTGLSYRTKMAKPHSALIGIIVLIAGLAFAAWQNMDRITTMFAPAQVAVQPKAPPQSATVEAGSPTARPAMKSTSIRAQAAKLLVPGGTIYVRRAGSVLRETEKPSGKALKRLAKGAAVRIVAVDEGWTQVKEGDTTGWMRTSVLGPKP
jgi:hypothetical protein